MFSSGFCPFDEFNWRGHLRRLSPIDPPILCLPAAAFSMLLSLSLSLEEMKIKWLLPLLSLWLIQRVSNFRFCLQLTVSLSRVSALEQSLPAESRLSAERGNSEMSRVRMVVGGVDRAFQPPCCKNTRTEKRTENTKWLNGKSDLSKLTVYIVAFLSVFL